MYRKDSALAADYDSKPRDRDERTKLRRTGNRVKAKGLCRNVLGTTEPEIAKPNRRNDPALSSKRDTGRRSDNHLEGSSF